MQPDVECRPVRSTEEFAGVIVPFVERDPVGHSVLATSVRRALRQDGDGTDVLWWVVRRPDGSPVAVGQHYVPHFCGVHGMVDEVASPAAGPVADVLLAEGRRPPGVSGPRAAAKALARAWCDRTGDTARETRSLGRWVLANLTPPTGVPGSVRAARQDEADLVLGWMKGFAKELGTPATADRAWVADRMAQGGLVVWVDGGRAVSLAGWSPPESGVSRVGPVWTPPELRGRGYGNAVTAAATGAALGAGARDVCLYTDLANPVSNAIYARVGFVQVGQEVEITFGPG